MKLTKRLRAVLDLVPAASTIIDVGTDHGYLAVALIKSKKAEKVIAADIHEGPLASAKAYVAEEGLEQYIDCRLGDGLQVLEKGEAQGAVICGMGGLEMIQILENAPEPLLFVVLQPQRNQIELRQKLFSLGYILWEERLVKDMKKLYPFMLAIHKVRLQQLEKAYMVTTASTKLTPSQLKALEPGSKEQKIYSFLEAFSLDEALDKEETLEALSKDHLLWEIGPMLGTLDPLYNDFLELLQYKRMKILRALQQHASDKSEEKERLVKEITDLMAMEVVTIYD